MVSQITWYLYLSSCDSKIVYSLVHHSKSKYVHCLHFAEENVLYVATNNGYLHHAELSDIEDVRWTEIIHVTEKAPIICMDVMTTYSNLSLNIFLITLGYARGNVIIVHLTSGSNEPKLDLSFTWSAELNLHKSFKLLIASSKPSNPLEAGDQGKLRYTWFTGKIGNNIFQKIGK
jgi:hypothetical protein